MTNAPVAAATNTSPSPASAEGSSAAIQGTDCHTRAPETT
jgi:hypothetical protein